jgi:hypothetical protein
MAGGELWRIEAADGRGPFRPGFSHRWRSPTGKDFPPPWVEAGISLGAFQGLFSDGFQGGCGCRSRRQLHAWFNFAERRRLSRFGFRTVRFTPDRILLETPTQVIFERRLSLRCEPDLIFGDWPRVPNEMKAPVNLVGGERHDHGQRPSGTGIQTRQATDPFAHGIGRR